ncbi:MAG: hypothetical protein CMJ30_06520, partial [Phycisphaerae bacterium]|nr:hypothetical protein [Phycisphaerae bacterium]
MSTTRSHLIDTIDSAIRRNPGASAKEIARFCRDELDDHTIRKSTVNPILYSHSDLWTCSGGTPPKWRAKTVKSHASVKPQKKRPVRKKRATRPLYHTQPEAKLLTQACGSRKERPTGPPEHRFKIKFNTQHYDWQKRALKAWIKNGNRGVVEAVTGAGKSRLALMAVQRALENHQKCLIVVPTISLFHQWKKLIEESSGQSLRSLVGANNRSFDPNSAITLGVVNSVLNNDSPSFTENFDLLIADECHRYGAEKWSKSLMKHPLQRLGLTATLERGDDGINEHVIPYFNKSKSL